ncbi:hypothetical protein AMECASPLE_014049, partial [Ameca splendens]
GEGSSRRVCLCECVHTNHHTHSCSVVSSTSCLSAAQSHHTHTHLNTHLELLASHTTGLSDIRQAFFAPPPFIRPSIVHPFIHSAVGSNTPSLSGLRHVCSLFDK